MLSTIFITALMFAFIAWCTYNLSAGIGHSIMFKIAKHRNLDEGRRAAFAVSISVVPVTQVIVTLAIGTAISHHFLPLTSFDSETSRIWTLYGFYLLQTIGFIAVVYDLFRDVNVDPNNAWGRNKRADYIAKQKLIDEEAAKLVDKINRRHMKQKSRT